MTDKLSAPPKRRKGMTRVWLWVKHLNAFRPVASQIPNTLKMMKPLAPPSQNRRKTMSEAPETREDIYYYVEDCVGGLRYMTRTLDLEVHQVLESWYRTDLVQSQIDAAVAAEREACARACKDAAYDGTHPADDMAELGCLRAWDKIRARGNTDALAERDARIRAEARRVKPLEWSTKGYAQTPFGKYLVVCEDWTETGEPFWFLCFAGKPYAPGGEHGTEADAKAAAQADYERRILSALIDDDT